MKYLSLRDTEAVVTKGRLKFGSDSFESFILQGVELRQEDEVAPFGEEYPGTVFYSPKETRERGIILAVASDKRFDGPDHPFRKVSIIHDHPRPEGKYCCPACGFSEYLLAPVHGYAKMRPDGEIAAVSKDCVAIDNELGHRCPGMVNGQKGPGCGYQGEMSSFAEPWPEIG